MVDSNGVTGQRNTGAVPGKWTHPRSVCNRSGGLRKQRLCNRAERNKQKKAKCFHESKFEPKVNAQSALSYDIPHILKCRFEILQSRY